MTEEQKESFTADIEKYLNVLQSGRLNPTCYSDGKFIEKMYHDFDYMLCTILGEEITKEIYGWMKEHDFCKAPASTRFHGAHEKGLFFHTYEVVRQSLILAKTFFNDFWESPESENYDISVGDIIIAAFFHDFCKISLYEGFIKKQPDKSGNWVPTTAYKCKQDNRNLGHGNESVLILLELLPQYINNRPVIEAISRHMGFCDLSDSETYNYSNFLQNPLVLLLQTADQIASAWYKL